MLWFVFISPINLEQYKKIFQIVTDLNLLYILDSFFFTPHEILENIFGRFEIIVPNFIHIEELQKIINNKYFIIFKSAISEWYHKIVFIFTLDSSNIQKTWPDFLNIEVRCRAFVILDFISA